MPRGLFDSIGLMPLHSSADEGEAKQLLKAIQRRDPWQGMRPSRIPHGEELDWQIWIAQSDRPYPSRYVSTTTQVDMAPQYTLDISDRKTGDEVAADDFSFKAPEAAKKLDPQELKTALSDMPTNFSIGLLVVAAGAEFGERRAIPGVHGFVSPAEAVVGRPLTPVSVAGVARRTARRCAADVYNC
jgi:hypothetical protein